AEGGVSEALVDHLADLVLQRFDLVAIRRIADSAPPPPQDLQNPQAEEQTPRARIGVAQDRAFGFYYQDTIDLLEESGAEIVDFSPLDDVLPPGLHGLELGGCFPGLRACAIAQNPR